LDSIYIFARIEIVTVMLICQFIDVTLITTLQALFFMTILGHFRLKFLGEKCLLAGSE
jgi:hypothetical protein